MSRPRARPGQRNHRHNARDLDTTDQMAAMVRGAEERRLRYADLIENGERATRIARGWTPPSSTRRHWTPPDTDPGPR